MLIVVIAGGEDQKEFQDKEIPEGVQVQFVTSVAEAKQGAEAYFYLFNENDLKDDLWQIEKMGAPFFVKKTTMPLKELPSNCSAISEWPGFLFQDTISVHLFKQNLESVTRILDGLQWKFTPVFI